MKPGDGHGCALLRTEAADTHLKNLIANCTDHVCRLRLSSSGSLSRDKHSPKNATAAFKHPCLVHMRTMLQQLLLLLMVMALLRRLCGGRAGNRRNPSQNQQHTHLLLLMAQSCAPSSQLWKRFSFT